MTGAVVVIETSLPKILPGEDVQLSATGAGWKPRLRQGDMPFKYQGKHATHFVAGIADGQAPLINGDDYDTPDGTNVRDYIHVADVAAAHVAAAEALQGDGQLETVYNLGSGAGTSVREVMDTIVDVTGTDLVPEVAARRPGDPARIVADGALAARDLDWKMRHSLRDTVASAWAAYPKK